MLRIDEETSDPVSAADQERLLEAVSALFSDPPAFVVPRITP